jgi:hypothetical protein
MLKMIAKSECIDSSHEMWVKNMDISSDPMICCSEWIPNVKVIMLSNFYLLETQLKTKTQWLNKYLKCYII